MSKKKKRTTSVKKRSVETTSRTTQIKLVNIARKLGTTVPELLESYGDAETIIEKFDTGRLSLLVEDEVEDEVDEETANIGQLKN